MEIRENKLGISEKVYHAQSIVEAFSKAMDDVDCLNKVPISVYAQIDENEARLQEVLEMLGEPITEDIAPDYVFEYVDPNKPAANKNRPLDDLEDSVKSRLLNSCFPCESSPPTFNLGSLFGNIIENIEFFIDTIKRLFDNITPNLCHFSYMLSFLCVPDLVRILAIILARILQLTSAIFIGSFALSAFIFGIIGAVFGAIMRFLVSVISFALAPVFCILQSLSEVIESLPVNSSLEKRLRQDQYNLLFGTDKPKNPSKNVAEEYQESLRGVQNNTFVNVADSLTGIKATVEDAAGGIEETFNQMVGLSQFLECEPKRSGTDIFAKITAVMELIQIANLIRSLIKKKSC